MSEEVNHVPPLTWKPYKVVGLSHHDRAGFLGRSAALVVDGIECIVHCRTVDDLAVVFGGLTGTPLDEERIYKATLVRNDSILVEEFVPEETVTTTPAEEQISLPLAEVPTSHSDLDVVAPGPGINIDEFLSDEPGTVANQDLVPQSDPLLDAVVAAMPAEDSTSNNDDDDL